MILYQKILEDLKKDKQTRLEGGQVGISYPFPRLNELLSVIEKGQSIGVLSNTGAGKSKWTRFVFIYSIYKFCKATGYNAHILYFPLEDAKEKVYRNMICYYLAEEHSINISVAELRSRKKFPLPDFVEEKLEEAYEYFEDLEKFVEFVDNCYTPTEIGDYCKRYAVRKGIGIWDKEAKTYTSDIHSIVVIDNLSNLDTDDKYPTERQAMVGLARDIVRKLLCNKLNFTVVQVLQMSFDKERQQFTHSGMSILSKLEPSLDGVGDAKTITRSMHLIFGLFSPDRFELVQYPIPHKSDPENYYRIDLLGDSFRSVKIIKNNDGEVGKKVALLFNANSETFEELPLPKTPELEKYYKSFKDRLTQKTDPKLKLPANNSTFAFDDSGEPF